MRIICDSTVSWPVAVTRINTRPSPLIDPPVSFSPTVLDTGRGSPVNMDSSTWVCPFTSWPSSGNRSPGRTTIRSPNNISSTGTSTSPSSLTQWAWSGRKACKARMASVVWRLARTSNHLPSMTKVMTTAEPSKYKCGEWPSGAVSHNQTDKAQPAVVPREINKSMLPVKAFRACQPAL